MNCLTQGPSLRAPATGCKQRSFGPSADAQAHGQSSVTGEVDMLELLAFAVVAVALATPFVIPLMCGQKTLVGALTVGAALIAASDFMQAADAKQFQRPLPMTQSGSD